MSDVLNLRKEITAFNKSERFDAYSKIIINVTDDLCYEAGDDTGRTLTVSCPWGTQAMANNLLAQMRGFSYQPYTAEGAILDPASELGDGISVNGVYSGIYKMDTKFTSNCPVDISAPADEEINYEYQYQSKQKREVTRKNKQIKAQLSIQDDRITTEVEERKSDIKTVKSTLEVQASQIVAKVNKVQNNTSTTFGWALETDSWRIFAGTSTVLKATKAGLEIKGKITATGGTIGGFAINSDHISYNSQTWGGTNSKGIYIGVKGIQLGKNFKVDSAGNLTATSGTFNGAVNATSGTIGGFAIKSNYISYNNQAWGGTKATGIYVGTNGIQLGKNFKVDSQGNLTAASGTFSGSVYAGSIRYGDDYGTLDGSALTTNSVTGNTISYSTISTSNLVSGIKTSLSFADYSNGVFSGWNKATTMSAYSVAGDTVFADELNVSDTIFFGNSKMYLGTITDRDGNVQRVVMWSG